MSPRLTFEEFDRLLIIVIIIHSVLLSDSVVLERPWLSFNEGFCNATYTLKCNVSCIVNCPSQGTEETTRPVENVALTMKGLQERKHNL